MLPLDDRVRSMHHEVLRAHLRAGGFQTCLHHASSRLSKGGVLMQTAYYGESFELEFDAYDARDLEREVDSASYEIQMDGEKVEEGNMSIEEDDNGQMNRLTFRFYACRTGMNSIIVKWRMGQDIMMSKHRINVEDL